MGPQNEEVVNEEQSKTIPESKKKEVIRWILSLEEGESDRLMSMLRGIIDYRKAYERIEGGGGFDDK